MESIKLPSTDNMSYKLIANQSFDVALAGFHVVGETTGRGHQMIADISDFKHVRSTVTAYRPGGVYINAWLLFFSENGRLTTGETPMSDPALIHSVGVGFPGGYADFSEDDLFEINTKGAKGVVVLFGSVPEDTKISARIEGLRASSVNPEKRKELVINESITSTLAGNHFFGQTSGRDVQPVLDVSKFASVSVSLDVFTGGEINVDRSYWVLLYDDAGVISNTSIPEFLTRYGPMYGGTSSRPLTIDVSGAMGMAIMCGLQAGEVASARVIGSVFPAPATKTQTVYEAVLEHDDLYSEAGDPKMVRRFVSSTEEYTRLEFYIFSGLPSELNVNFYDRGRSYSFGLLGVESQWDGERFSGHDNVVRVPRPGGSGKYPTSQVVFPLHKAASIFDGNISDLEYRITPVSSGVSEGRLAIKIVGIK